MLTNVWLDGAVFFSWIIGVGIDAQVTAEVFKKEWKVDPKIDAGLSLTPELLCLTLAILCVAWPASVIFGGYKLMSEKE